MLEFSKMVANLSKPGEEIVAALTADRAHCLHMAVGVSGEAGELLDAIKKWVIYNKPLDVENIIEELGDIEFYLEGLRQKLDLNRELILQRNMKKLLKGRYKSGMYSDSQAINREDKK